MDTNERYQIVETIAQGDFATVYRARDQELGLSVAHAAGGHGHRRVRPSLAVRLVRVRPEFPSRMIRRGRRGRN